LVSRQVLDELVGLRLRVNHERPSSRLEHDDGVFNRQVVGGKLVGSPGFGLNGVFQNLLHGDVVCNLHSKLTNLGVPLRLQLVAVERSERS
jgi:hypothetical protein